MTKRLWILGVVALALAPAWADEDARLEGAPAYVPGEVLVKFLPGTGPAAVLEAARGVGAAHVRSFAGIDVRHWRLGKGTSVERAVEALSRRRDVAYAEPNYVVSAHRYPSDPRRSELWGLHNVGQSGGAKDADIDAPEAWDLSTGSPSVVVGIVDTGIDPTHPDLAANLWTNPGETPGDLRDNDGNGYVDDVHGWDFVNGDADPMDDNGHGTHTAGTVGARGDDGIGVAGVAWNVRLMALKFLDAGGNGSTANAILAIQYAASFRQGGSPVVRVTSNSWGGGSKSTALSDAIAASGALFVASAGNNGNTARQYPAAYGLPNVVAVAATDASDLLAGFSTYGGSWVHLAAPGVDTLSALPGGKYGLKSGTSMACPHVSGTAALLLAQDGTRTAATLRSLLLGSVDPLPGLAGKVTTGGRLNACRALGGTPALDTDTVSPADVGDLTGAATDAFSVTLSWTATGDDGGTGTAYAYDVRRSATAITTDTWSAATTKAASGEPLPGAGGEPESFLVTGLAPETTYWFALRVLDDAGNATGIATAGPVTTPKGAYDLETLAGTGGYYKGLGFDARGWPGAAYSTGDTVRAVLWDGSRWGDTLVDGSSPSGAGIDFAFSPTNVPSVSYGWGKLRFAEKKGTTWTVTTVDRARANNDYTSLAYDADGNPAISYRTSGSAAELRLARRVGSTWQIQTIAVAGAKFSDLAFHPTSGHPAIAFSDDADADGWLDSLKVARWNGSGWGIETVETGVVGYGIYASAAFTPSGDLVVAHSPDNAVRVFRRVDAAWQAETLPLAGGSIALAVDASGTTHVGMTMSGGGTRVASRPAAGGWTYEIVDAGSGGRSDVALDGTGRPAVLYGNAGSGIRLARKPAAP